MTVDDDTLLTGVSTSGLPADFGEVDAFEAAAGHRADVVMWFVGWGAHDSFDAATARRITERGAIPMITWEPWDYRAGTDQPSFRLARIAAGAHDDYVRSWATAARDYGDEILLRFGHEMNGDWYPWSEQVNGNGSGDFVLAWRHVHDVFDEVGADNVTWVWSPQAPHEGTTPLAGLYPGDDYVDWVALDGYNGGTALPWGGWVAFEDIFAAGLVELDELAPDKPVMIGETASTEAGGDKAAWIEGMFATLRDAGVDAVVWFNHDKETDWRIQSSPSARDAFSAAG